MNWFVLALISSITLSLREYFVKRNSKDLSPVFLSWGMNLLMFITFFIFYIVLRNEWDITTQYAAIVLIAAVLDTAAMILYLWAIQAGDLSKTIPMLCFIPVVQLFVTPVLVNENLSLPGIIGVLVVVSGSYILNLDRWNDFFSPFKNIIRSKGVLMMLSVAFLWGISSSFHKMGVKQTSALFWGVCEIGVITVFLTPLAWLGKVRPARLSDITKIVWPAVFSAMAVFSYYAAIGLGPVAYTSSVRRLGVLFSMIAGIILFKEKLKKISFLGGMIMIAGAVIITLLG